MPALRSPLSSKRFAPGASLEHPAVDRSAGRAGPYAFLLLFSFLLAVYTLTGAGGFHIVDEVSLFAVTESLGRRGAVDTNAIAWTQWVNSPGEVLGAFGPDGTVFSKKGPAPAFAALPWYVLIRALARLGLPWGLLQGTLLWNGVVTAATAVLLWLTARTLGYRDRVGAGLALLFGLATMAWPYANHFFGEPLSALALLLCFWGAVRWRAGGKGSLSALWLAGLGAGVAVATVTAHILLVLVFAIYLLWMPVTQGDDGGAGPLSPIRRRRGLGALPSLLPFILPIALVLAGLAWYNFARFGDPLATGYHFDGGEGFTTPIWQGAWGLLVSPYRGLFWHNPLLVVCVPAWVGFWRVHRAEAILIAGLSLVLVATYSMWWMWWGGFAWGPRFLVPLLPLWLLLLAPWLGRVGTGAGRPSLFAGWVLLSFLVQLSAVLVNYVNWEIELRSRFPTDWSDPLRFGPPALSLADLAQSPVFGQWRMLLTDPLANTDLAWVWADGTVLWPVGLAGALAVGGLGVQLVAWWRGAPAAAAPLPLRPGIRPGWMSVVFLPLFLLAIWLGFVGRSPSYGSAGEGYRAILAEIGRSASAADAIITVAPYHYQIPMNWLGGVYGGGELPIYGYAASDARHREAEAVLARALERHDELWYVSAGLPPAAEDNTVERWLADHGHKAEDRWYGDFRLVRYASAGRLAGRALNPLEIRLSGAGSRVALTGVETAGSARPGTVLPVALHFRVEAAEAALRWFVQMLDGAGAPVALLDTTPADGYATFAELSGRGEQIERAGLALPPDLAPGRYRLIAGLYRPGEVGGERLQTADGDTFVELAEIVVEPR